MPERIRAETTRRGYTFRSGGAGAGRARGERAHERRAHTASAHIVGPLAELPEGAHRVVAVNGVEIGVFNVHGRLYAIPNYCFHQGGPLCEGKVGATIRADRATDWTPQWTQDGEIVVCPWHGMEFDITTGRCLARRRGRLRQYPVTVEDGQVVLLV